MRDLAELLGRVPVFAEFDARARSAVAAQLERFCLPGGAILFEAGDPPDALYVVLSGSLAVHMAAPDASSRQVGRVTVGESVGEMALLSGQPRSASVTALRDTELARFSREAFDALVRTHPGAMLQLARLTAQRLEAAQRTPTRPQGVAARTFALLPGGSEDLRPFARELAAALAPYGRCEVLGADRDRHRTSEMLHAIEAANTFVLYVAEGGATPWTRQCLRQADTVLLVVEGDTWPHAWPALEGGAEAARAARPLELVLRHREGAAAHSAREWLAGSPGAFLHHVRTPGDIARVARLIAGRATCLVLSGGGARGFAHIGVIRALEEAGRPIDAIGGTSIGAIMGAGAAAGWSSAEMTARFRRTFVETNPLSDYTLPWVSLVAGRKVARLLGEEFGERDVADLPLPFFCVSSNLTTGRPVAHRAGPLVRWLRASVAIPGVLPPVVEGGEVYVDGGATNNLPVDVMRGLGRGTVIGVDVGADEVFRMRGRVNILQILVRSGMVNSAAVTAAHRGMTDLLLSPPLASIDMLDWRAFDRAIEAGYRYAREHL